MSAAAAAADWTAPRAVAPSGRILSEMSDTRTRTGDTGLRQCVTVAHPQRMLTHPEPFSPGVAAGRSLDEDLLDRFATSQRAEGASENTVELRVQTFRKACRETGSTALTLDVDDIRRFLAGYSNPNTRSTHYRSLRSVCRWLVAEGLRTDDPTERVRAPRVPRGVPRPCSTPALEAMFAVATQRERAMLTLAAYGGLRAAEIASVRGEHFDLEAATLRVRGKGGVEAVLPLHPEVIALAEAMPARGWWFPARTRPAGHLSPQYVSLLVRAVCKRAGVPLHGAHPLRHWFATTLVRGGADLRTTQTLMRHASLATTARYVEVADDARRAAVLRLPTLAKRD